MTLFDVGQILIIGGFALFGIWFGLISTLGSLLGTVLGVYLASRWYAPFAEWLINITGWTGNFPKVVVFIISFLLINRLVGFGFHLLDRSLSIFTRLPLLNGLNRLLGLIFGLAEGIIVLGIAFQFINKYPLAPWFMEQLGRSKIAPLCLQAASILWPLVPEAVTKINDYFNVKL